MTMRPIDSPRNWRSANRFKSLSHAWNGARCLLRTEANARIHLLATGLVVGSGVILRVSAVDWRWLITAICMVWGTEALNTAIEYVCDVLSPEWHAGIGRAKDVAAAAVLISAAGAAAIGVLTLYPYLQS